MPCSSSPSPQRRDVLALVLACLSLAWMPGRAAAQPTQADAKSQGAWESLFDGKTLGHWKPTDFFGRSTVTVDQGRIVLEAGKDLTGITWAGPALPTTNYEIALEAMKIEGSDFFAGVTFPVADSFCSLILGGWGGTVVGLSSINGMDASENQTSQSIEFDSNRWYRIRIRVTPEKIQAWLDDKEIIDANIKGEKVETRIEVDLSQPLGIASFRTKSALRDIRLRRL